MRIKDIIIWLLIFIVGSLIVSFLISPNSFYSFKSNIKNLLPEKQTENPNYSNAERLDTGVICSLQGMLAEREGISKSEIRQAECSIQCSYKEKSGVANECVNDKLICYCQ